MNQSGCIIVLAYPDTFVKMSDEWICRILPLVGLGTRDYIKAGHAAQLIIDKTSGAAYYYDFGRYVTPKGHGRVRSAVTDVELHVPISALFDQEGVLLNLDEFLLWLERYPEKTHGQGRLIASVCYEVDFNKAKAYADDFQRKGSIPYGAFIKKGSNCARFVTDTILASTDNRKVIKSLNFIKKFTPSTVGNVEKSSSFGMVYTVYNGTIELYRGKVYKENLKNYFDKDVQSLDQNQSEVLDLPKSLQKLEGIGSSCYFEVIPENISEGYHRIKRYNEFLQVDFDGVYYAPSFNADLPFTFTYDSHCGYCHIIQENKKIKMVCVSTYAQFNSLQKERSA